MYSGVLRSSNKGLITSSSSSTVSVCSKTGEAHLYHRAYWHEGKMYYKGNVVIE